MPETERLLVSMHRNPRDRRAALLDRLDGRVIGRRRHVDGDGPAACGGLGGRAAVPRERLGRLEGDARSGRRLHRPPTGQILQVLALGVREEVGIDQQPRLLLADDAHTATPVVRGRCATGRALGAHGRDADCHGVARARSQRELRHVHVEHLRHNAKLV